jgi:hypothetical protein
MDISRDADSLLPVVTVRLTLCPPAFGNGVDNFLAGVVSGSGMPLLEKVHARDMIILP